MKPLISSPVRYFWLIVILLLVLGACKDKDDDPKTTDTDLAPRLQAIQDAGKVVVGTAVTRPF